MAYLQMCSISSMVRLLGIVFPISVFFSISASGQIRAITVFHPDDNEEFGFTVKPPKRKVLQGI